jgi:hypothetical protein
MSRNKFLAITACVFLMLASACSLPVEPAATSAPIQESAVPLNTQVAEGVASTEAAQTALANALASTLAAMSTDTPQVTFTPSLTPTPTFTLTPEIPMVSVSVNTYCRTGPGAPYDILGILTVGQTAQVVGRSTLNDNWIIKLPPQGTTCWLWGQYATVAGSTAGLPVINPPPTPTPAPSFTVAYSSTQTCIGSYGIKFKITNNGSVTWESNRISAKDLSTSVTKTIEYDNFPNYNSSDCSLISADLNLAPGEAGTTSIFGFSANPAGHSFTATIRVCSQNGLAGVCLEKTISFTP